MDILDNSIIYIAITCVLLFFLPILFIIVWKKKKKQEVSWKPLHLSYTES